MTPVIVSDFYILAGGALGAFGRRWATGSWRQRETVTDVVGSALATVLLVGLGIVPDAIRAILTVDPVFAIAFAAFASAGAVGLIRTALGKYGFKAGETIAGILVFLCLAVPADAVDRGTVWQAGGITPLEDGANFAVLPMSDSLTLLYTRKSTATTQLRIYRSPDGGATVTLAQDSIVTGRATAYNPNAALLNANGQTVLAGFTPGAVSTTPEVPWLVGTGSVWTIPTASGLPTIGPTAAPFPSPFSGGFLRAVSLVMSGGTILSPVDNNSSNPPVVCRSTTQGASWACVAMPASIGTVRWRDPASASTTTPGTTQPLASPTPTRWLLLDSNAQVFRSVDDGLSWALVTQLTTDTSVSWAIVCLPGTQTCVALTSSYASTMNRIFVSRNAGDTWTQAFSAARGDLLTTLVAAGGNTILALGDPSARLPFLFGLQSQDGGTTWLPVGSPPRPGWGGPGAAVALTPANEFYSGAEELDATKTAWNAGSPTFTTLRPRAVGPGHSFLSDTIASYNGSGLRRDTGLASCTSTAVGGPCVMTIRYYFLLHSQACAGTGTQDFTVDNLTNSAAAAIWAVTVHFTSSAGACTSRVISLRDQPAENPPGAVALGSTQLAIDQWYRIEQTTVTQAGLWSGTLLMYLEDSNTLVDALSLVRTVAAGTDDTFSRILWGNALTGGIFGNTTVQLDDAGYRYASGSSAPTLAGASAIWTVPPTSDVSVQWTPKTGTSNFAMVNGVPGTPNDGTTENHSGTTNLVDRLGLSAFAGVPLNWEPFRGFVNFRATEGGTSAFSLARFWDSGGNTLSGTSAGAAAGYQTALINNNRHLPFDPNGADTATAARWNIGYQGKVGGTTATMTAAWLNVDFQILGAAGGGGDSATGVGPQPFWANQQPYVRPDGSVLVWAFWSGVLGSGPSGSTPAFIQAFNAAPTIPRSAGVPLPKDPTGVLVTLPRGALLTVPGGDISVTTAATVVLGTRLTRLRGTCVNLGPDNVRLGDATVTSGRGVRVAPGNSAAIATVAAVYAIAEATAATVTCSEDLP